MSEKNLIVVVGPTAVGKTELCIQLAQRFNTAIISADSRQFYKEISIGTAKPTGSELSQAPHYFINSHSIEEHFSAGDYEEKALDVIDSLFLQNNRLILTGGSGLFIKAITDGFDTFPEVDLEVRNRLNEEYDEGRYSRLVEELKSKDPEYYSTVDLNNYRRVIRALEIIRQTEQPFSSFRTGIAKERNFKVVKIGLERPREELYARIDKRVDIMLELGLLEEVRSVYKYKDMPALQTVGYSEVFDFMDGVHDWEEAVRLIKRNSRRYAKRQLTWFKRDEEINWFHPDGTESIINFLSAKN